LSLHGIVIQVEGPPILARTTNLMFSAYPEAGAAEAADLVIEVSRVSGSRKAWTVKSGAQTRRATPGVSAAARWTEWMTISEAMKCWSRFVQVHAGLVATAHESALLVGKSGSGKSTTTVALALEGLSLYSDDVALIDRDTLRAYCAPRPIKLDSGARRLLRGRGLTIPRGTWLGECIDRTVIPGLPPVEQPGPPLTTAIFFADGRQDVASIRRISSADAVMRLILQSVSERFEAGGPSEGATALINAVQCYELTPGNLDSTVRLVRNLLGSELPSPSPTD
jgi:hypothetical protein